jgi:hypothetical protein
MHVKANGLCASLLLPRLTGPSSQDENCDGVFTVDELIRWIEEHKLVTLVEEDRDTEMDVVIANQPTTAPAQPDEKVVEGKGNPTFK